VIQLRRKHVTIFALTALLLMLSLAASAVTVVDKTLPSDTRFMIPQPDAGASQQAQNLLKSLQVKNAVLIAAIESTPQAQWISGGTPAAASQQVTQALQRAQVQQAVPVFALYNIPGRDCGSYSAGGAQTTADYEAWIDAIAAAIGDQKVVIILEPDGLANLPSNCGYSNVDVAQLDADRYTQINYAVTALEANPKTLVYLDAGNSAWQSVGTIAQRLVNAGLANAQGFFTNVSNYQWNSHEAKYDTWVSECIAFANDPEEGGWRLGHYDWCASQYYPATQSDFSTWSLSDAWYAANMGTAVPTAHFVIDTSRNGQGPLDASVYGNAPYNQPSSVISTLNGGNWCNPPARGVGVRPTANTGVSLLDAYLWVKIPGESDGTCNAQGGVRAWDYGAYTKPGWPTTPAGQAVFDPLWGLVDPAAGAWFPQQALDLAQRANPKFF